MGKHLFEGKPRHLTPQIDLLKKISPVVRVSTHMYGVSKEIHGKTLACDPSNQSSWKNESCSKGFITHLWGFSGD